MKRIMTGFIAFILSAQVWAANSTPPDLILDFRPGTLLLSSQTHDFEVLGPGPQKLNIQEVEQGGKITSIPNMRLGIGLNLPESYLDLTGVIGVLLNERFRSLALGLDGCWQYRAKRNVSFGPHLGLMYFPNPEWTGDADVDLESSWATTIGFQLSVGYDILFVFSLDYLAAQPFDADVDPPWKLSDDELDFSGVLLQFGVQGRL